VAVLNPILVHCRIEGTRACDPSNPPPIKPTQSTNNRDQEWSILVQRNLNQLLDDLVPVAVCSRTRWFSFVSQDIKPVGNHSSIEKERAGFDPVANKVGGFRVFAEEALQQERHRTVDGCRLVKVVQL
jgi:hypothetical protein